MCDNLCAFYDDCCKDACEYCGVNCDCKDNCGEGAEKCWCDELCHDLDDCCADVCDECGDELAMCDWHCEGT